MLKKIIRVILVSSMAVSLCPMFAQETAGQSTEMPELKQPDSQQGESGLMDGDKPFTLMVDEQVGELIYVYDEETKELESITAKRGVIFASEDMTLNSDEMEYKTLNSSLVATGKRVVVRMGEMIITCQIFKYNPETQEGEFLGKPIVYNRDKEGKVTTTGGNTISVVNVNGKFQMRIGGGGGTPTFMKNSGTAKDQPVEKKKLAPGEKPASITLNNTPSGLAVNPVSPGTKQSAGRSNSLIPMPAATKPGLTPGSSNDSKSDSAKQSAQSGKIDPNNPDDVKKLTDKKN